MFNKIISSLCVIALTTFSFVVMADVPANWQTYTNTACGYTIKYPPGGVLGGSGAGFRKGFYLDPVQFVDNLAAQKVASYDPECTAKISLPIVSTNSNLDGKYLILLTLDNAPKKWPPPFALAPEEKGELVLVGNRQFYKLRDTGAGMCHEYNYTYYFTKDKNKYYVGLFLLTAHCPGVKGNNEKAYDLYSESKDFNQIISSFNILNKAS